MEFVNGVIATVFVGMPVVGAYTLQEISDKTIKTVFATIGAGLVMLKTSEFIIDLSESKNKRDKQ